MRTIIFLFFSVSLLGQNPSANQTFSLEQYLDWVKTYHPVMKQAQLLAQNTDARLLEAKGVFDPKWYGDYEDKSFDEKNYFRLGEAGLKIPTWWGVDVKLAYQWSNGQFLNNEATLPQNGQAILGVDVPILQGLTFDQRRAQVKLAQLFKDVNEAKRQTIINDLLFQSIEAYWNWVYHFRTVQIYQSSLQLAENRFDIIKQRFLQGDKPAIDTLESMIQIQNRNLQLSEAKIDLQNAVLELSNYLWFEDMVPLELMDNISPSDYELNDLKTPEATSDNLFQNIQNTHPDILALQAKGSQLEIKERLKKEQFKPQLRFNYNLLGNGFDLNADIPDQNRLGNILAENYKWGLQFSYPLLLRKERGGLQLVQLDLLENKLKIKNKALQQSNKVRSATQALATTFKQFNTQDAMVINYEKLLEAENEKFRIGESSIFLINNREQKLIEAQMKLIKLETSVQKLQYKIQWARGLLR